MSDIAKRLEDRAEDPMWADHAEVRKDLLAEAAREIRGRDAIIKTLQDGLEIPNARNAHLLQSRNYYRAECAALQAQLLAIGPATQGDAQ